MKGWIDIIRTDRKNNECYVAWYQDDPKEETNFVLNLHKIEDFIGCYFDDGEHPWLRIYDIDNLERFMVIE